nr:beta-galactosidase [Glaciibacter flavus]
MTSRFVIGDEDFLLDGEPFRVLSGALHYFRVHPDQWAERIRAAKIMGLNTIETYVAWNQHAPTPDTFDVTGRLDLAAFLDTVSAEGLHAIVRPGPYICAEFDNGGLPGWLTHRPDIALRSSDPAYLDPVEDYLTRVIAIVRPRQIDVGGPVILMQIENEYGAYGDDAVYLRRLVDLHREQGITVPFTTIDQPQHAMLTAGGLPDILRTASFGSKAAERLRTLRAHQPSGPLMCAEFWDGWFDNWGGIHHTTSAAEAAAELDALLTAGASVNIYMFHGGTNFGLTNGANHKGRYVPIATTYDYDAPLDELGRPTDKYWAFRTVIARHFPVPEPHFEAVQSPVELDAVFEEGAALHELPVHGVATVSADGPPTFDDIGHYRGIAVYTADISGCGESVLEIDEVRDRAWVSVDGRRIGILTRSSYERALLLPPGNRLEILVEDQGRVNYGPRLGEAKGLMGPILLGGRPLEQWVIAPVDLDVITDLPLRSLDGGLPHAAAVVQAEFDLDQADDLILDTSTLGKGFAWVNGFFLGRYWQVGPQRTLYVPRPVTVAGANTLTVLELDVLTTRSVRFVSAPDLGPEEE